ncbi:helix-turn-helix transcriptional regulator [Flavihumibacter rivuli]|uniref:winged helix-turn-helix transcriptional regulator n=1 Tax=Flavihumibacter rivuli TaxID=2838156 RepID=UPI001BDE64F9|nr:helix-turn-helix domain-containing protein [Flavihumibacter rivuli]ULQ56009.1 helix-turn-helix transcriptional regulator [Flavihumibacter rivuli]
MAERKINSSNSLNESWLEERCVLNKVLKLTGKRWVPEILLLVENGQNRFSSLKDNLPGISDNVLSTSLTELTSQGLIHKEIFAEVPLRVEYELTDSGKELARHLHALCQWGKLHIES